MSTSGELSVRELFDGIEEEIGLRPVVDEEGIPELPAVGAPALPHVAGDLGAVDVVGGEAAGPDETHRIRGVRPGLFRHVEPYPAGRDGSGEREEGGRRRPDVTQEKGLVDVILIVDVVFGVHIGIEMDQILEEEQRRYSPFHERGVIGRSGAGFTRLPRDIRQIIGHHLSRQIRKGRRSGIERGRPE